MKNLMRILFVVTFGLIQTQVTHPQLPCCNWGDDATNVLSLGAVGKKQAGKCVPCDEYGNSYSRRDYKKGYSPRSSSYKKVETIEEETPNYDYKSEVVVDE